MSRQIFRFTLAACTVMAIVLSARADEIDAASLIDLRDDSGSTVRPAMADSQQSGKLPIQFMSKSGKKPGVFQRMGKGTKNLFNSTKNAVTFKKKPASSPAAGGVTSTWKPKSASQEKQGSWWGSLFQKKPERHEPQTMKEWLSQERPKF